MHIGPPAASLPSCSTTRICAVCGHDAMSAGRVRVGNDDLAQVDRQRRREALRRARRDSRSRWSDRSPSRARIRPVQAELGGAKEVCPGPSATVPVKPRESWRGGHLESGRRSRRSGPCASRWSRSEAATRQSPPPSAVHRHGRVDDDGRTHREPIGRAEHARRPACGRAGVPVVVPGGRERVEPHARLSARAFARRRPSSGPWRRRRRPSRPRRCKSCHRPW